MAVVKDLERGNVTAPHERREALVVEALETAGCGAIL